jgi:four helix bundle protein
MTKNNLEDRLINLAVSIIRICGELENSKAGNHMAGQLVRCGTSPALNYAEAQGGESRKDFIHKMKIVQKELRESLVALKIVDRAGLLKTDPGLAAAQNESNELISIFVKSISTAQKNLANERSQSA